MGRYEFETTREVGVYDYEKMAIIEDGKPIYMYESRSCTAGYSYVNTNEYTPEDKGFDYVFRLFASWLWEDKPQSYKKLIEVLDEETLEKHFEKMYVPK